jgi:hypothetical protein
MMTTSEKATQRNRSHPPPRAPYTTPELLVGVGATNSSSQPPNPSVAHNGAGLPFLLEISHSTAPEILQALAGERLLVAPFSRSAW